MLKTLGILLGITGAVIFALPLFAGIFNAGSLGGTVLSLCLLTGCILEEQLKDACLRIPWLRYVLYAVQAGYMLVLCASFIACVCMYRECRNTPGDDDRRTVVVLGCGLEGSRPSLSLLYRLQAAEAWLKDHPDTPVVVSGGQGSDEIMPEAQCMAEWLIAHGIEESRVFREERSSSTYENLMYTRTILQDNGLPEDIIIVSNNFHVYRAGMIARKQGYDSVSLPAKTTSWLLPASAFREVFGIIAELFKG